MKEIIAVIRMSRMESTKNALAAIGFESFTAYKVSGRGKQHGLEIAYPSEYGEEAEKKSMRCLPKRMISIVVEDCFVPAVVALLMKVNRTGRIGDGRIFVCPIEDAVRIRTGERGDEVIS